MSILNHTADTAERLAQAAAHLQQAFSLIQSVAPGIVERLALGAINLSNPQSLGLDRPAAPSGNSSALSSIIDQDTFSVRWADCTCRLGNTFPFRLLARLARRPNQFISYEVLLKDVWDDEYTSPEAVRSAVKVLRRKLTAAGMAGLAEAIDGSTSHHYALKLVER